MEQKTAALVGAGSIGITHFKHLLKRFDKIIVIDPKIDIIKKQLENYPGVDIEWKKSIYEISSGKSISLIVISNWGPDHFSVLKHFAGIGSLNFLIEKPLVDSLKEIRLIKKYQEKYNLKIYTHLPMLYAKFTQYLLDNSKIIGDPIAINVFGGAKCVATNGIHYIALANKLFKDKPEKVMAYLNSDPINPRNKKLKFYEGNASWFYPDKKQLNINFSNNSQVTLFLEILYKFSRATIHDNSFALTKINDSTRKSMLKPTSTKFPSDFLVETSAYESDFDLNETSKVYDLFDTNYSAKESEYGFSATEDLITALISSKEQKLLKVPIQRFLKLKYFSRKWGIS